MTTLKNDYRQAFDVDGMLFAVQLSDDWSVADGPGTVLCGPDERELAGWHVPVRFADKEAAAAAILTGPNAVFDIERNSAWSAHCVAAGGLV